jgi:hypothetical protein
MGENARRRLLEHVERFVAVGAGKPLLYMNYTHK